MGKPPRRRWAGRGSEQGKLRQAPGPDPVHHEGGALLEDAEVFLLHALRGVQEQVEVQVTRSLDLDFSAHVFWEKYGGGTRVFPHPALLPRPPLQSAQPCCAQRRLSPKQPAQPPAARHQHSPDFFWVGLVDPSRWDKEVPSAGATSSGKSYE